MVRTTRLRRLASSTSFASTSADAGRLVVDDLDRGPRVALHPREDLEAAPAAVAPQRVRGVRDVLQLLEHEARHDQRAVDEPGLHDLGDPAVDEHARVDDDVRVALGLLVLGAGPADQARALGRRDQVARLATVSPIIPRPRNSEIAERQPRAERAPIWASGRLSSRPIRRPTTARAPAATNSAVDSSWTLRDQPAAPARP